MTEQYYALVIENIKAESQLLFRQNGEDGFAVRIEDESDGLFWRPLIETALPNKAVAFFPYFSKQNDVKITGKDDFKHYAAFADKQLIFCRDADYDYLLENPILNQPFVFHTYIYGRENYYSLAEGLEDIVEKATQEASTDKFDFSDFFQTYSKTIYPYLVSSLYSTQQNDNYLPALSARNFGKTAGFIKIDNPSKDLSDLKQKLAAHYGTSLATYHSDDKFEIFKNHLSELGLSEDNAYLFMSCHDVFDRVFLPVMKYVGDDLTKKHFAFLTTNKEKKIYQAYIEINSFKTLAQSNPQMFGHLFYQRIIQNIQIAFQN